MGELVYRKELWSLKDRSEWQRSYSDLVEAAYAEAVKYGTYINVSYGSSKHSGMYAGSAAGSGRIAGSRQTGSLRIGSGAVLNKSSKSGSFPYAGSGTSKGAGRADLPGGIMSLGYGIELI